MSVAKVVLVVEDEPLLRLMATDLVEECGFTPLSVANARQALRILEARDDIRIVFTDIDLNDDMTGIELAFSVRDRWPPVDFLIVSGKSRLTADDMPARSLFFSKPYDRREVAESLQRLAA